MVLRVLLPRFGDDPLWIVLNPQLALLAIGVVAWAYSARRWTAVEEEVYEVV